MNLRQGIGILAIAGAFAALSAGLVQLGISAAAAYAMANYGERIFNVRLFPEATDFPPLVGGFLAANQSATVVVGSSFSFGYPFPATMTISSGLKDTINASVVGAGLEVINTSILCEMAAREIRPKTIVLEVPLINELSRIATGSIGPLACPVDGNHPSLLGFALRYPAGTQWFKLLNDPFSDDRDRKLAINQARDGYFITKEQFEDAKAPLASRISETYGRARALADDVYMFITPIYVPGVASAGDDPEKVQEQYDFAAALCREIAGPNCIDTRSMLREPSYYSNITHLNGAGAAYFRSHVAQAIGLPEPTRSASVR